MILHHPLGKGFWKVVKQDYYDSVSILYRSVFEMFFEKVLARCETGLL